MDDTHVCVVVARGEEGCHANPSKSRFTQNNVNLLVVLQEKLADHQSHYSFSLEDHYTKVHHVIHLLAIVIFQPEEDKRDGPT